MPESTRHPITNRGPGTPDGPRLPATGPLPAPSAVDRGEAHAGKVEFPNWRGPEDRPAAPPVAPMPPDRRVRFALVGLGRLSLEEILPAFGACTKARVVALVSGDAKKARTVADQYGIRPEAIHDYGALDHLGPDVDAVYVVTPNGLHREHVEAAARGKKHVLCQKPMANTAAEARAMVDACDRAGVKLMIAYRCQFEPFNVEAARLAQSGELGRARIIEASNTQVQGPADQWRLKAALAGGGALPDIGLYCLNGARTLLGEEPIEVFATIVNPGGDPRYAEVEETVSFMLRFPSGAIANCAASYGAHESKDLRVRLEKGSIELENAFAYRGQRLRIAKRDGDDESVTERRLAPKNQFSLEIDHFADCILEGKAPKTSGAEGARDQVIMEAIYRSAREGRPVRLD